MSGKTIGHAELNRILFETNMYLYTYPRALSAHNEGVEIYVRIQSVPNLILLAAKINSVGIVPELIRSLNEASDKLEAALYYEDTVALSPYFHDLCKFTLKYCGMDKCEVEVPVEYVHEELFVKKLRRFYRWLIRGTRTESLSSPLLR
jgi:hypothetical protein